MSSQLNSLLDLNAFSLTKLNHLFSFVRKIKNEKQPVHSQGKTIGLLFFEASTRTRMSFESAAYRIGLSPILLDGGMKSSLEKGETIEDSILNVAAMGPEILVVRCGDNVDLQALSALVKPRIINAGWGSKGHPTQALLDAYTMQEKIGDLKGKTVLFLGDIRHSRVAASHFELLQIMGIRIILCAPAEYLPQESHFEVISDLDQALAQSDVVIALRSQFERHSSGQTPSAIQNYRQNYGLSLQRIGGLRKDALIMHPGPVNQGIEIEKEVMQDPRTQILQQVTNGVYIREAILRMYLEGEI